MTTHSLTVHTPIDLHRFGGGLHALFLGAHGPRITATLDGLEALRDSLTDYLDHDEDDDPRPPESEYETLGRAGWDRPSRGG